ncbi:tyrosine-type recombinase/integrase [Pseudomonas coronafaciens]|nr:tyrosine-type recombinase/integrase [Pseudomonas coronafaciens]
MRVPISSADLRVKYGFNRLAKKLQRNWPSDASLSLAYSQEILSRGLGYQDFHDLQRSADKPLHTGIQPSQDDVRDRISTSIVAFCQSKRIITISDRDVVKLVALLPLQELTVFQAPRYQKSGATPLGACLNTVTYPPEDLIEAFNPGHPGRISESHEGLPDEVKQQQADSLSQEDLNRFWKVVQRNGSLRDQCFCLGLLEGVRLNELVSMKIGVISPPPDGLIIDFEISKAKTRKAKLHLPSRFSELVGDYIRQVGLSPGDYLFPSSRDPGASVSPYVMRRVVDAYLQEALPEKTQRRGHLIRQAVRESLAKNLFELVSERLGHTHASSTLAYYLPYLPFNK